MNPIIELAKKHNLYIIEDAACGFGSKYDGKHVGNFGKTGVFSFHPRKAITTGEGGMITTGDEKLASKKSDAYVIMELIFLIGKDILGKVLFLADQIEAGHNQRMTDIQAALGSAQMERANKIINERKELHRNMMKIFHV